jgi:hypothetical protein
MPISGLGLCNRAYHCAGYLGTVAELLKVREDELMARRSFGRACLADVRRRLAQFALDALSVPPGDPMRVACVDDHPAVTAVWEAPPQPRPLAEVLEEILELLARGEQLRAQGTRRAASRTPLVPDFRKAALAEVASYVYGAMKPREREVVELRFSAPDADAPSLAGLGRRFGLTRERIRQILVSALERLRKDTERQRRQSVTEVLTRCFEASGGVSRAAAVSQALAATYSGGGDGAPALARVLLETTPAFRRVREEVWCLTTAVSPEEVRETADLLRAALRRGGRLMTPRQLTAACGDGRRPRPDEALVVGCVVADPQFRELQTGRIGLREWEWGIPGSTEEYAVACLRARGRPMTVRGLTDAVASLLPPGGSPNGMAECLANSPAVVRIRTGVYDLRERVGDAG